MFFVFFVVSVCPFSTVATLLEIYFQPHSQQRQMNHVSLPHNPSMNQPNQQQYTNPNQLPEEQCLLPGIVGVCYSTKTHSLAFLFFLRSCLIMSRDIPLSIICHVHKRLLNFGIVQVQSFDCLRMRCQSYVRQTFQTLYPLIFIWFQPCFYYLPTGR